MLINKNVIFIFEIVWCKAFAIKLRLRLAKKKKKFIRLKNKR